MMKKKPTRKYAVGGMTAQTDMFNAASKAAMQKANAPALKAYGCFWSSPDCSYYKAKGTGT
jgi:hypothetical protein